MPLLEGSTIEEVGDRFEGDARVRSHRGRPGLRAGGSRCHGVGRTRRRHRPAVIRGSTTTSASLPPTTSYAWDLAAATGQDAELDEDLVSAVAAWYAPWESAYRAGGAVGARSDTSNNPRTTRSSASAATSLARLTRIGREGPRSGALTRIAG